MTMIAAEGQTRGEPPPTPDLERLFSAERPTGQPDDASAPFVIGAQIDRIDRLPSGRIEVIDYKTGSMSSQMIVDESLKAGDR